MNTRRPKEIARAGLLLVFLAVTLFCAVRPVLAADENSPDLTTTGTGTFFRWLNFALVIGGLIYVFKKYGGPYFQEQGSSTAKKIRDSAELQAAAMSEIAEAERQLAQLPAQVEELRRTAARESAAETERIRALARSDAEKIRAAAQAEIHAAERAGRQELRSLAARLATEQAEALVKKRLSAAGQTMLFRSFLAQLPGGEA